MITNGYEFFFVGFAFLVQVLLILNFAARNWKPELERRHGWVIYALGIVSAGFFIVFWLNRQPWYLTAGFGIYAVWAAYGFYIDHYRGINWRDLRIYSILVPYVGLFILCQFAFWIPMWSIGLGFWIAYSVMYALNTSLNLYSHRLPAKKSRVPGQVPRGVTHG